ncbi:japanin-like-RS isoform X5 [Dermacentor variabilis]|uniref:japanin-like-RS isoform X5 n=1 Tax=Dermacentor variabilis TaxID=34621 RepID=UPI003F5C3DD6
MYIQLLAPFAVYAFVFASHCLTAALDSAPQLLGTESHGEVVVGSPQFPIFPANNSQDLYLVGYSSALEHQDIRCVSSTFHKRRGEEVDRYLLMYIHDEQKKSWDFTGFKTTIYIPDSPIIFSINVAYEPERALCSLWTNYKYYRTSESGLPVILKNYFDSNCAYTKYVPYPGDCKP